MDGGSYHCTGGSAQNHPKEKEMQEAKVVDWGSLTNSLQRRELKGKGDKERYTQLNAEFQRITRRGKKAFLNKQYKEIEENNGLGKTIGLFKKIGDIKRTLHVRMGMIKTRNSKGLSETD